MAVVGEIDGFPVEDAAVRTLSGAVGRAGEFHFVFAELLGDGGDVRRVDGPANEARVGHGADLREVSNFRLCGIGSDDFQVAALTQREESVACAAARMDPADGGENAGSLLDKFDALIEIVAAENDVIEQSGHVIVVFIARDPQNRRSRESAASYGEEISARENW